MTPAVDIQLNLLRSSRLHPQLSGHCHLNGLFDYNKTPLLPLATKSIIYVPPKDRSTWDFHGLEGWYLGPSLHHHRSHHIFMTTTKAQHISDTVDFFPAHSKIPGPSPTEAATLDARDLISALNKSQPPSPCSIGGDLEKDLQHLAKIFKLSIPDNTQPNVIKPHNVIPPACAATYQSITTNKGPLHISEGGPYHPPTTH